LTFGVPRKTSTWKFWRTWTQWKPSFKNASFRTLYT